MTTSYTAGAVSVSAGQRRVTGVGTNWTLINIAPGFFGLQSGEGSALPAAEVISDTELDLVVPWSGPSLSDQAYWLSYDTNDGQQTVNNAQRLADYVARLDSDAISAIAGLTPESGKFIKYTGTNTAVLVDESEISGGGGGGFDAVVPDLAARAQYDGRAAGFTVIVADIGDGRAAVYRKNTISSGDWSIPVVLTGPKGDVGDSGPYTIIQVGTVSTLDPGESVTASFSPVSQGVVALNIGVPRGADGADGEDGTGDGTVTSVGVSVPTGFSVANSPVTSIGTIAITYSAGYRPYTDAESTKLAGISSGAQVNLPVGTTSGTVAAGDDARFSQGGSSQNEAIFALEIADLKGSRLGMRGGVADAFDDETGVDVKTNAVYDATNDWYTPSPNDVNTLVLLHLDGANGSTAIIDSASSRAWTASGDAKISTAQSVFGGSSLALDGTSDSVRTTDLSGLTIGTGDFCFEGRIFFSGLLTSFLFDARNSDAAQNAPCVYISGGKFTLYVNGAVRITGTMTPVVNTWYHVALTRSAGVVRLFINGVQDGANYADASGYSVNALRVGSAWNEASALNGYIDEFRISNIARWSANFAPPSQAYAIQSNNMTLQSIAYPLPSVPANGRLALQTIEFDTAVANTDFVAEFSRDNGTTWTAGNLVLSPYIAVGNYKIYESQTFSVSSQPSGSAMKWRVRTLNNKNIAISGVVSQGG